MKASTSPSTVVGEAEVRQSAAACALAYAAVNFVSAVPRQALSPDVSFLAIAFEWHFAFAAAFLPAAANSFDVHLLLCGSVVDVVLVVLVVVLVVVVGGAHGPKVPVIE